MFFSLESEISRRFDFSTDEIAEVRDATQSYRSLVENWAACVQGTSARGLRQSGVLANSSIYQLLFFTLQLLFLEYPVEIASFC